MTSINYMHTSNDLVPSFITRTHARVSHSGLVVKCFLRYGL